jgi:hypothetical protein
MASYNSTPGKCLIKNHPIYGSIYLNLNKYNKYYIRTKINDISNNYNIPSEYNNNANLTLKDALNIIENVSFHTKNDTPATAITINNNFKLPETEIKGKFLGKVGNDSLFLNHSKFNNKYYLKLTSLKDNIPINKDIDVEKLTLDSAKEIVDSHVTYNNKIIGKRDDQDVVLKNGQYGLYLIHDKKLYTLPKFILDKLDTLDIKKANYIIDYQLKIKNNNPTTNEDINVTDDNNIVENIIPTKKSFLDAVKSN